ncbi:MAG TPA: GNAT family N-acetyltransferase [Candidatus Cybelea sp.]|jgi:hypothetical protein
MRVEPVSAATQRATLEYLDRSPYDNAFISHVLLHDASHASKSVNVAFDDRGVAGVAYCGRHIVIAAEPRAVRALAASLPRPASTRMIIGPRETVTELWRIVGERYGQPRLVRNRQLVMMVDRQRLIPVPRHVTVRHARLDEWRAVADGSAEMIRQELEYDPRRGMPNFDVGVRQMIERKLWWVGLSGGRLCFYCHIGPWSKRTLQLQGIWTPPELRGRGLATASLAAICDRLLEASPTLSLYVNDFNEAAIALYRRAGFEHVGDFQTILF